MKARKKVVFVVTTEGKPGSNRYDGFASKLQAVGCLPDADITTVALENLAYWIDENGTAGVTDLVSGIDIGDADFVYLKTWEAMPEEAAALAIYLQRRGVAFIDELPLGMGVSKLASAFRMWSSGLPVPATLYVRNPGKLLEAVRDRYGAFLGERFIVKDIVGAKGKHNFLINAEELAPLLAEHADLRFVCQKYIPNDGDYRLGYYIDGVGFVIKRVGSGQSHLNNISAGGSAQYIPSDEIPAGLANLARDAARAARLQIAGVDILIDIRTGKPYILEVNQGSQIVSGAHTTENKAAFAQAMNRKAKNLSGNRKKSQRNIIGRRAYVSVPALDIQRAVAKIDTGAYTSTVHAEHIRIERTVDSKDELVFDIVASPKMPLNNPGKHTKRIKDFFIQEIRSSNGLPEMRYSFKTEVIVQGIACPVVVTLSDRSTMKNPILIGRRVLKDRFVVDVALDEDDI